MIVDDRLETVLRTAAAGPGAIRTQFRQLADLLGRTPPARWTAAHSAALDRLDAHRTALGDRASAALLRTVVLRSPILVEHFANGSPKVALAAITGARLPEADWLALIPDLPVQARGFLRHRRDLGPAVERLLARLGIEDFVLPLPAAPEPLVIEPLVIEPRVTAERAITAPSGNPAPEGIGAIVQRIEAFRRNRDAQSASAQAALGPLAGTAESAGQTRLPFADEPPLPRREVTMLDLRIDAEGTVIGADAAHAAMLVGVRPFTTDSTAPASCDAQTARAVRAHLPIAAGLVALEGAAAVAGAWRIDAVPVFAPMGGRFLGYHARLRRPPAAHTAAGAVAAANDDEPDRGTDRLRQMLHELRTPINAIQGFAELIQQQLLGPTPHQYRSLAAGIASDAAHMLAGFEDIERLAILEAEPSGSTPDAPGLSADLAAMLTRLLRQLEPVLAPREIKLRCDLADGPLPVAFAPVELERTLWRLLSVIAGAAAPGERLTLTLTAHHAPLHAEARLTLPLPAALAMRDDAALLAPDSASAHSGSGMLGGGFALRLAAAEVRAGGGTLIRQGARLDIALPLLTAPRHTLSHNPKPADSAG